jgi:hypothetical protein
MTGWTDKGAKVVFICTHFLDFDGQVFTSISQEQQLPLDPGQARSVPLIASKPYVPAKRKRVFDEYIEAHVRR